MSKTWVVVAGSSRARIFTVSKPRGPLQEREDLTKPSARQHETDLTSDRPGRSFDSWGKGRHAYEEPTPPKAREALEFSREVADRLDTARARSELERLVLVAAPAFLGLLRQHLGPELKKHVVLEIDKDLSRADAREIRAHLPERL